MPQTINIARRLAAQAQLAPDRPAIVVPGPRDRSGGRTYQKTSFSELNQNSDRIAAGLLRRGLDPGMKLVLFVPFSEEFITLTFALFKAGAIVVLIDPGMGRRNIFRCLAEVRPDGFVAVPLVHLVRLFSGKSLRKAPFNICVGPRLPGLVATYRELIAEDGRDFAPPAVRQNDAAAIIFTSGSTGAPKGVLYEHGMFDAQVDLIRDRFQIEAGEIDLPGFPLFGLFNAAMGVTTVIPDMDPTRPAQVDPRKIIESIEDQQVTQAFGSPAFWNRIGRYCNEHRITLPSLKRALSAGGPVPNHVLERMSRVLSRPGADLFTPYGATESLPISSIGAQEILDTTAALTRQGRGTCVGTPFPGVDVKIIEITEGAIPSLSAATELPANQIGEIVVSGPSITREYYLRPDATRLSKIPDGDRLWHRIGDLGYFDEAGRLWFCGRKAHLVETDGKRLFSVCCEAIFNEHPRIYRSALIGIGQRPNQRPIIVAEPEQGQFPRSRADRETLRRELIALGEKFPHTRGIEEIRFRRALPVDTRHNVKINREALAQLYK
jgi:acyl-CoA synthetase (AMP-forming)/AMP-acid ligase II